VFNDGLPGELAINALPRFRTMLTGRRQQACCCSKASTIWQRLQPIHDGQRTRQMLDAAAQMRRSRSPRFYQTYDATFPDGTAATTYRRWCPLSNSRARARGRPAERRVVDPSPVMRDRRFVGTHGIHTQTRGST
jgi:hypothetical protein